MKTNCESCKNIRAVRRHPYCIIPRDNKLIILTQREESAWAEVGGGYIEDCPAYCPKKKEKSAIDKRQLFFPGCEVMAG